MVLVLGMTAVIGCKETEEGDTWSDVTSLSQLDGTWKGKGSYTQNDFLAEVSIDNVNLTTTVDMRQ